MEFMDDELYQKKNQIRRKMKTRLSLLSNTEQNEKSSKLCTALAKTVFGDQIFAVAGFLSLPGEPDLRPLFNEILHKGKTLFLPRIDNTNLVFHHVLSTADNLSVHAVYGMAEPAEHLPLAVWPPAKKTLILVPGLAFDLQGKRLGRGKGFYDRFLHSLAAENNSLPLLLGTGFSCQMEESVPADNNDFLMNGFVCENGIILF